MKRLICICTLCLALLGISACGAPVIEIPVGDGALAYADVKAMYAEAKTYLTILCAQKKIDEATCGRFGELDKQMAVVDRMARKVIHDSKAPVDWAEVMAIMGQVMGLAMKAGLGI